MTVPDRRSGDPQRGAIPVLHSVAHSRIEALSRDGRSAAAIEEADSYYSSLPWYANFAATCLDPGERLRLYELSSQTDRPIVLFLRARADRFGPLPARTLASLTNYYSCGFSITGLDSAAGGAARIADWARGLRRGKDRPDRITFDALDAPSPSFDALVAGLRNAGYMVETYPQFGNWYLTIQAPDFDAYWASRDARLRNTVERKERKLRREHRMTMEIMGETTGAPTDIERAIGAYEEVYAESWKTPEPYSAFIPGLIRTGFASGVASVGILRLEDRPVAAQLWIRHRHGQHHRATIFKLAHAESVKQFSVGSILTRHMMRHAFDENGSEAGLQEIDFGRGDDPYKRLWTPERRQRWGVIAYEPATPAGLAYAARNLGPKAVRRFGGRLLGR